MIQGECEKCEDRGEEHGFQCIVRKLIFNLNLKRGRATRSEAMEAAVAAFNFHYYKQREKL